MVGTPIRARRFLRVSTTKSNAKAQFGCRPMHDC